MAGKRNEMIVGSFGNITQSCPQMRHRFAVWAREELTAWLFIHRERHQRAAGAFKDAGKHVWTEGARKLWIYHTQAVELIDSLILSVQDRWDTKDWHNAIELVEKATREAREADAAELLQPDA